MNNVEKSEVVIAKILNHLMEKGLQRGDLRTGDLGLDEELQPFFEECCFWLINEGLITVKNQSIAMKGSLFLMSPQITSKGFAALRNSLLLGAEVSSVQDAIKATSNDIGYLAKFGEFSGSFLGALTKSLTS